MTQDELKVMVGRAALDQVVPGSVVGVGTGSTVNCFIDALATMRERITGAVSSSEKSSERLRAHGIAVLDSNAIERIPVYIDGADEIDPRGHMIKGGGAALTREKIVADLADRFICIADVSKRVAVLGRFPLPVEVIPMARSYVARQIVALGGQPVLREGVTTDNGNCILDVHNLAITDPVTLESALDHVAGVVTNGLFSRRGADILLIGRDSGVETMDPRHA